MIVSEHENREHDHGQGVAVQHAIILSLTRPISTH